MASTHPAAAIQPTRVRSFAIFFKNYMSVSSLVTAALPIPVTAFGLIPTFAAHTRFLATYTSLFCFLLLGFIFSIRHELARLFFPDHFGRSRWVFGGRPLYFYWHAVVSVLPLGLIAFALYSVFTYHSILDGALAGLRSLPAYQSVSTSKQLLVDAQADQIPGAPFLIFRYLCIFLSAEAAFMLMAIKEYLQDLLHLSEWQVITGPENGPSTAV